MNMWSLEGQYASYLATSPSGTATGFGCSLMIIDDVIKNAEEANNETKKEALYSWFTDTMLSRVEEGGKIIIIMTRWASNDLAGKCIEYYGDEAEVITMKAQLPNGEMLCDEVLSLESFLEKQKQISPEIFQFDEIKSYTDTADTGQDYLCSLIYGVKNKEAYILDVIYTKEPMEITEPLVARHLYEHKVNKADIESNNGGRGFSRQIDTILKTKYNTNHTIIHAFHQSKNKQARILSNATWIMEHVYFPLNWHTKYPEFYKALTTYQREGKNAHDDASDALTGVAESINIQRPVFSFT